MNKEELVKKMNEIIIELKNRTNIDAWLGGYLCAFAECLEWVNELDEPRVEECGCYICDVPDSNNKTVLENYPQYQYSEYKGGEPIYQDYTYCPNCGRKIKKGEKR